MREREYAYAGGLYTCTILFLAFTSAIGLQKMFSELIGTDDYVFSVVYSQFIFLIPVIVYLYLVRKNLHAHDELSAVKEVLERTRLKKTGVVDILMSFIAGLCILPFLYLINGLSLLSVKDVTSAKVADAAEKYPIIVLFLTVAVFAPFIEELSYRGIFFGVYKEGGEMRAAFLTAIMFGLMHSNLNQFAYAVTAGFLFAMFSYAGGSIICSLIMHMIVNGSSVIALYYPDFFINKLLTVDELKLSVILKKLLVPTILGLFVLAVCFMLMRKSKIQRTNNSDTNQKEKLKPDAILLVGILAMLVNMIANEFAK